MMGEWYFIPWNIQYVGGGLLAIAITVLVFRRNPQASSYRFFLAFGTCLIVWMLSVFIGRSAPSLSFSTAIYRIILFSFLLAPPLLLLTILSIGSGRKIYYLTLIPILPLSLHSLIAAPFDVIWTNFGWTFSLKQEIIPLGMSIVVGYYAVIITILVVLILKQRLSYLRKKYGLILSGILLYFIPLTITNVVIWSDPSSIRPFGGFLLTIEFLFIAYAVSLRSSKIKFTTGKPLGSLAETWLGFLQKLRDALPGGELGEDAQKFDDVVQSLGLSDIVHTENSRQTLDAAQLALLDMNETMGRATSLMKKQELALQALIEYTKVFTELYRIMKRDSTEFASNWLNTMLRKHGGFLDKQGILSALPPRTKLPSIFEELQSGKVYLFKEEKPTQAYEKLKEALGYGFVGLCFTKLEPQKVRATYRVEEASIIWLTFQETNMEENVSLKNLRGLSYIISTRIVNSSRVVVLLDCLDQIIFANSFEEVRGLLSEMNKLCEENAATLLLSIGANMFKKEQMDAIEEELGKVK